MAKPEKHVFSVGERVCFPVFLRGADDSVWHIGEIASFLPVKKQGDMQSVHIVPYEIPDQGEVWKQEDWETVAPLYFSMPTECIILDRLSSQTKWNPKKLSPHFEVDIRDLCVAKHYEFLGTFVPKRTSRRGFPFPQYT